ncbi:hypothetical protein [Paenibacillus sp. FSL K6-2524]|uniref:hypothetical protein n=1 Tax=Paenibacillus sp. FSL K6-2524 TaxID=2954516 RepID=UPI0030FABC26
MVNFKKIAICLCVVGLTSFSSIAVFASEEKVQVVSSKTVDELESSTIYEDAPTTSGLIRVEKVVDLEGVDKSTGKIIDKETFRNSLLKFYNTDKVKYSENIKNINSTIDKIMSSDTQSRATTQDITPFYADGQVVGRGWSKEPKLTSSENRVTFNRDWVTEDNYRSAVAITVSYTKTLKISRDIGFEGAVEIKNKFGFSASASVEQTSTISQGANVPAWTAWGYRPYIKYKLDQYSGEYYLMIYAGGAINTYYYTKTGSNYSLITKSNEYWSRINTSQSLTATTPTPPTGAPNV